MTSFFGLRQNRLEELAHGCRGALLQEFFPCKARPSSGRTTRLGSPCGFRQAQHSWHQGLLPMTSLLELLDLYR